MIYFTSFPTSSGLTILSLVTLLSFSLEFKTSSIFNKGFSLLIDAYFILTSFAASFAVFSLFATIIPTGSP